MQRGLELARLSPINVGLSFVGMDILTREEKELVAASAIRVTISDGSSSIMMHSTVMPLSTCKRRKSSGMIGFVDECIWAFSR
jgi:hypothetical protein